MEQPIRFLCDENVRLDVAEYLAGRGHTVLFSREMVASAAPDQVLALLGKYEALVIVSHDRDFRKYRSMLPEHERGRFSAGAGRLWLRVGYQRSLQRVEDEIENIEHHYRQAIKRGVPFLMEIQDANIKITTR